MKTLRNSTIVAAALTVCAMMTASPASAGQRETEQFDRRVPLHSGGRLKLNNFSGRVTITGGDSNEVVIHAIRHGSRDRLDHIKIDVQSDADEVSIEANRQDSGWRDRNNNVVETEFDIQVPRETELDVRVFSSRIEVSGVSGSQKLHAFSGDLRVADATGPMDAETFSGDIDVAFKGTPNGRLDFDSFSGRINSSRPIMTHSSSRRSRMEGELGSGGDMRFRFKTFSGDVTLR